MKENDLQTDLVNPPLLYLYVWILKKGQIVTNLIKFLSQYQYKTQIKLELSMINRTMQPYGYKGLTVLRALVHSLHCLY